MDAAGLALDASVSMVDAVWFRRNGTARAVRRLAQLEPEADRWPFDEVAELGPEVPLWTSDGPVGEVLAAVGRLPEPKQCVGFQQREELVWGTRTAQVVALFFSRGWWLQTAGDRGVRYEFLAGPGNHEWARRAPGRGAQWVTPYGLIPTSCLITPTLRVELTGWHVHIGCPTHQPVRDALDFDDPGLLAMMRQAEQTAHTADLPALAHCLVFGDCSQTQPDWSKPLVGSPHEQSSPVGDTT